MLFITGCPQTPSINNLKDPNYKDLVVTHLKSKVYKNQFLEYDCGRFGYEIERDFDPDKGFTFSNCDTSVNDIDNERRARQIRNEVIDDGISKTTELFEKYKEALHGKRSQTNFAADLSEFAFSIGIGTATGGKTPQILNLIKTAFMGSRKSFDINFYREQTTQILVSKMSASRDKLLADIEKKKEFSTDDYSFDSALRDIIELFYRGTLTNALNELAKDTSNDALAAEKKVRKIKKLDDEAEIVTISKDAVAASISIGNYKRKYQDYLDPNKAALVLRTKAGTELFNIYKEITTGDKSGDFKSIIEELKKDQELEDIMSYLDDATVSDASKIGEGLKIAKVIFSVFQRTTSKPELLTALNEIMTKHQS